VFALITFTLTCRVTLARLCAWFSHQRTHSLLNLKLNNAVFKYVNEFKYLGHIINNDKDDNNALREVANVACLLVQIFWLVDLGDAQ